MPTGDDLAIASFFASGCLAFMLTAITLMEWKHKAFITALWVVSVILWNFRNRMEMDQILVSPEVSRFGF